MSSVSVRLSKDYDLISELDHQIFNPSEDDLLSHYILKRSTWWIAKLNNKAVGFCGVRILPSEPYGAYLVRAGVLKRYRGRGVHRRLLQVRVNWARRNKIEELVTYTVPSNHPSMNNLIRAGFTTYKPGYRWAGDEDVVYWHRVFKY